METWAEVGTAPDAQDVSRGLARALDVVAEVHDVLDGRVYDAAVPAWCATRGLEDFLLALDETTLARAEAEGLAVVVAERRDAPASLVALCREIGAVVAPFAGTADGARSTTTTHARSIDAHDALARGASPRKRAQVAALADVAAHATPPTTGAGRIVDIGAGHGHLTRALSRALGVDALGLERVDARVARARALAAGSRARFETWDARAAPLPLRDAIALTADDVVVALHACGDLTDLATRAAAESGAAALLVSCCLQKIATEAREPLSAVSRARGFALSRAVLGLSNVTPRARGVESAMPEILRARETRYALRLFLAARGLSLAPGEESRGINRRQMRHGLGQVAPRALEVWREALATRDVRAPARVDCSPPTAHELADVAARARHAHGRIRRFELVRSMLGRLVEVTVALDRAAFLAEHGRSVSLGVAFDASKSPRNLVIASPSQTCAAPLSAD